MNPKIICFEWDNKVSDEFSDKDLIIGVILPQLDDEHIHTYGLALTIIDERKDFRLHHHDCYRGNMLQDAKEISKDEARDRILLEVNKMLDLIYDEDEMKYDTDKIKECCAENIADEEE